MPSDLILPSNVILLAQDHLETGERVLIRKDEHFLFPGESFEHPDPSN
jgi:hypothetical protein